uniref:SAM domain-containing protein n=1 Tax=Chenopodium quinoa TaxID=63459 RepID=A0A803MTN8_CHEQI
MGLIPSIDLEAHKLGGGDLRLKLQRRSSQQDIQGAGVRDLREKLTGSMHTQPVKKDPPKPKPDPEASKPTRRSVIVATPIADKKVSNTTSRKKTQQKVDASVDGFLQSLGLEKYLITFKAEE